MDQHIITTVNVKLVFPEEGMPHWEASLTTNYNGVMVAKDHPIPANMIDIFVAWSNAVVPAMPGPVS